MKPEVMLWFVFILGDQTQKQVSPIHIVEHGWYRCSQHLLTWGTESVKVSHSFMPVWLLCSILIPHRISLMGKNVSKSLGKLSYSLFCLWLSCLTFTRWLCSSAPSRQNEDCRTTLPQDSIARINPLTVVLGTRVMRDRMNTKDYWTFDF